MISIFVMYSSDRRHAFEIMLDFLRDMPLYSSCQKTLVVDGFTDWIPEDWHMIRVPRIDNRFCWGDMWNAGVGTAKNDVVLYLDSDRLLPSNFLEEILDKIVEKTFVFTSNHYMLLKDLDLSLCHKLLNAIGTPEAFSNPEFMGSFQFDPKYTSPNHGSGKNVMSGSVAFYQDDYWKSGGVDRWYCGHGAFADTDYHNQAAQLGCKFFDLKLPELHYFHNKVENNKALTKESLHKLSIRNFVYYCNKWDVSISKAEDMAHKAGISKPSIYVKKELQSILV